MDGHGVIGVYPDDIVIGISCQCISCCVRQERVYHNVMLQIIHQRHRHDRQRS